MCFSSGNVTHCLQGEKTGRLLKYDPQSKATTFIAGNFAYSNGVALGPDENSLLVVETVSLRVARIWLKGPKASPCTAKKMVNGSIGASQRH